MHIKQSKTWLKCPVRVTSTHMDVPLTICSPSDDLACILQYNAVLQLDTDVFTFLQHCCYVVVCRFVGSLMAFVCQEIKGLLTYLLIYFLCFVMAFDCQEIKILLTYLLTKLTDQMM